MWSVSETGGLNGKSEVEGVCVCVCATVNCVSACSAVLKGCQCLVVSAGSFLSGLLERCQQPEGIQPGLAWRFLLWSPAAPWMREQQQVNQCVKHGTNKDFIPPGALHLNILSRCFCSEWAI